MNEVIEQPRIKCIMCEAQFTRRLTKKGNVESWSHFKRRKYCSDVCRNKNQYLNKDRHEILIVNSEFKLCVGCNKYFTKNIVRVEGKYPIRKERTSRFNAREYCCKNCFLARKKNFVSDKVKLQA